MSYLATVTVVVAGATVPLLGDTLDAFDDGSRLALRIALWSLWGVALLAVLVPSPAGLTALRLGTTASFAVTVVAVVAHPFATSAIAVGLVTLDLVVALSADVGNRFVQASAYGSERRFLLRCPRPLVAVQVVSLTVWIGSAIGGVATAIAGRWPIAIPLLVVAIGSTIVLPRRFHRLSRRWLVAVPAGLVVHDHVQLAETAMFASRNVRSIEASTGSGDALDLSGCPTRPGLVVSLGDMETVVLAADRAHPGGRAMHASAVRVCPTRPGWALRRLV